MMIGWKMKKMLKIRFYWFGLTFAVAMMLVLFLIGIAFGQAPGHQIPPLNPDFAYPTRDTPERTEVNSASLVENANLWNGHIITFTGEAIGEAMVRGKMAWIHLNDDTYMWKNIEEGAKLGGYNSGHAVWISADLATKIRFFGDFKHEGDVVKVVGTFHAACPQHGGDMDIHASTIEIVRVGHTVRHIVNTHRAIIAGILFALALILHRLRVYIRTRYAY
jgi:hypothetical protein